MRSEDEIRERIEKIKQQQESNQVTGYIPVQDVRNILISNFNTHLPYCVDNALNSNCKDCTDCVLKQIVDKCIKYIENYNDKVFYDEDDVQILMGKVMLSQSILSEILDIQEVE